MAQDKGATVFAGKIGLGIDPTYLVDVAAASGINVIFRGDDTDSWMSFSSDHSNNSFGFDILRSDSANMFTFDGHTGSGTIGGTWTESSDERLKENIETIEDALSKRCK